ncbi:MAG: hypothetical protein HY656_05640, partial [Acidobacteria bacterium]|nr:hypothetical protein [Acidobacteriota bacterium]
MAFLVVAIAPGLAWGQAASEVTLDASPQLFTVLAALRAAGEARAPRPTEPGSVWQKVDAALAVLGPDDVARLQAFFERSHPGASGPDVNHYISAALVLGPPPEFGFVVPPDQLPQDVYGLEGFPSLLRDFYARAGLDRVWGEARPLYEQAIAERQAEVARMLLESRTYLRLMGESTPGRSYVIYLEWLAPPGLTSARSYGDSYFLVIHPRGADFLGAVRHQYLHFLLDPIAAKYAEEMSPWMELKPVAEQAARLPTPFRRDLLLLATECLVQAAELRLRGLNPADAATELDAREREGYLFLRHFYHALTLFEQARPSMRLFFPELVRDLDVGREKARLQRAVLEAVPPGESLASAEETARRTLAVAESYLTAGNYAAARERLERILRDVDPNHPGAFY